jgi:hypothetical protein
VIWFRFGIAGAYREIALDYAITKSSSPKETSSTLAGRMESAAQSLFQKLS